MTLRARGFFNPRGAGILLRPRAHLLLPRDLFGSAGAGVGAWVTIVRGASGRLVVNFYGVIIGRSFGSGIEVFLGKVGFSK